ncbi:hypothetical protein SCO12_05755 [Legionella pneumophila serogroup 10]
MNGKTTAHENHEIPQRHQGPARAGHKIKSWNGKQQNKNNNRQWKPMENNKKLHQMTNDE